MFVVFKNLCNFLYFSILSGDIDDLEFWLSTDTTPAKQTTPTEPVAGAVSAEDTSTKASKKRSKKKGGAKVEPTPEVAPVVSAVMEEPEPGEAGEVCEAGEAKEEKRKTKKGEKVCPHVLAGFVNTHTLLVRKMCIYCELCISKHVYLYKI